MTIDEQAAELHARLEPGAQQAYLQYFSTRTPPELQDAVRTLVEADFAGTPTDPTTAQIANGDQVAVIGASNFPAPGSPGAASVINGILQGVQLTAL